LICWIWVVLYFKSLSNMGFVFTSLNMSSTSFPMLKMLAALQTYEVA
jgi:hypothetical protein